MRYAEKTTVSSEQSKAEIERLVTRYGATAFATGWQGERAAITFEMAQRRVRFVVPLPDKTDRLFTHTPGRGLKRSDEECYREWEQACRQRWRALALVVKAKLEAVETGISTFESEFLANVLLPDGKTVGEHTIPKVEAAYQSGKLVPLLPGW